MSLSLSKPLRKTARADLKVAALWWASRGVRVFPVRAGEKKPILSGWQHRATTDPEQIRRWWTRWPDANIATPTGDGRAVVDVDPGGDEALEQLGREGCELPPTLRVDTPRGGYHLHYSGELRNSAGTLGDGLDTRGTGGFVLLPPSRTADGTYQLAEKRAREQLPAWVGDRLSQAHVGDPIGPNTADWNTEGGPIHEGTRNNSLTSIGGKLRAGGADYAEILAALVFVNRSRCNPALPEAEVEQIARSVVRYPKGTAAKIGEMPEVRAAVDRYQREVLHGRTWARIGDLSVRDVLAAIILKARRFGWLDEDGHVVVSISYRELALIAAARLETAYKAVARAKKAGLVASANAGRKRGEAGAFKLLIPGRAYPEHSDHVCPTGKSTNDGKGVPPLRAPLLRHPAPGFWRLGKGGAVVVHYLESLPARSATLAEIAGHLGLRRARDLYRVDTPNKRGRVWRLEVGGIVAVSGVRVSLADNYLEKIDECREEGGEFAARREQIRRFNQDRERYHGEPVRPESAPSERDMDEYQAARPLLVGDAVRAHAAIMDPNTKPGRVYATRFGSDLDMMAGAVAAHFRDSRGDPQAWQRWVDPVAQALSAMNGEVCGTVAT